MAGTDAVLRGIAKAAGTSYSVLAPNAVGMRDAVAAAAREVAVFVGASESFSQRNIRCSIETSLERVGDVVALARPEGIRVRAYVSCVLGCPYEGPVAAQRVAEIARRLLELGCYEISLGDTIGTGTPRAASEMVRAVVGHVPVSRLAVHYHDTFGQALANVLACLETGVTVVDAAAGGLGGCPYATGASGNLATEDLLYMLDGMGIESGVSLDGVLDAVALIERDLGIPPRSKLYAARRNARMRMSGATHAG